MLSFPEHFSTRHASGLAEKKNARRFNISTTFYQKELELSEKVFIFAA
jgi:hypothetical protein